MAQTIRTCSLALLSPIVMVASAASAGSIRPSVLGLYARARLAEAKQSADTTRQYRGALMQDSGSITIAFHAFRAGVDAGDSSLALGAAQALDRLGVVPPDAEMLLYVAAVRAQDWTGAHQLLARLGRNAGFSFMQPLLSLWLPSDARSAGLPDPAGGNAYASENAALFAIAKGEFDAAAITVKAAWAANAERAKWLRIVAAASLLARGRRDLAAQLLTGDDPTLTAARRAVQRSKHLAGAVDNPARATSFLLARMSGDLLGGDTPRSALTVGRLATFADPESPFAAFAAARAFEAVHRPSEVLALVDPLVKSTVFGAEARALRVAALEKIGRADEARRALVADGRSDATLVKSGDLAARQGDYVAALADYRAALDRDDGVKPDWQLLLSAANAADQSGDWPTARKWLEQALSVAPDEPVLLNQLGFGLVVHGEASAPALALIEKASAIDPGNAAITDSLGWAHFRLGNVDRAIVLLEAARAIDGTTSEIGEHLGDAYWTAGRRIEARYAWTAAHETADAATGDRLSQRLARGLP